MLYKKSLLLLVSTGMFFCSMAQKKYILASPDKTVEISIAINKEISYAVLLDKKELIGNSLVSFKTDADKGDGWKVAKVKQTSTSQVLTQIVAQKSATVTDQYNQLHIDFANGLSCR